MKLDSKAIEGLPNNTVDLKQAQLASDLARMRFAKASVTMDSPIEDAPDNERTILLDIEYSPGYPAKISGPYEDCYPGECGEINDYKATFEDGREVPSDILDQLDWDEVWERITDDA